MPQLRRSSRLRARTAANTAARSAQRSVTRSRSRVGRMPRGRPTSSARSVRSTTRLARPPPGGRSRRVVVVQSPEPSPDGSHEQLASASSAVSRSEPHSATANTGDSDSSQSDHPTRNRRRSRDSEIEELRRANRRLRRRVRRHSHSDSSSSSDDEEKERTTSRVSESNKKLTTKYIKKFSKNLKRGTFSTSLYVPCGLFWCMCIVLCFSIPHNSQITPLVPQLFATPAQISHNLNYCAFSHANYVAFSQFFVSPTIMEEKIFRT